MRVRRPAGPALAVHAGAGRREARIARLHTEACRAALEAGWAVLEGGGSALDAAVAAVELLESEPTTNAGLGSALTREGGIEMDALVMAGPDRRAGAVAGVPDVRHPVRLALRVLEEGEHVILCGEGASRYARETGEETCDPRDLVTERALERLERWRRRRGRPPGGSTVGAVALDPAGLLASATSTGGRVGRRPGRIGDTPVPGAGGWADGHAAVSATGVGEAILRSAVSLRAAGAVASGRTAGEAARSALGPVRALALALCAGLIVVDAAGRTGAAVTGGAMPVARRTRRGGTRVALIGD